MKARKAFLGGTLAEMLAIGNSLFGHSYVAKCRYRNFPRLMGKENTKDKE